MDDGHNFEIVWKTALHVDHCAQRTK